MDMMYILMVAQEYLSLETPRDACYHLFSMLLKGARVEPRVP